MTTSIRAAMQIICQCKRCGQQYQVGVEWANRISSCQRCGVAIQIPPAPTVTPVAISPMLQPAATSSPAFDSPKPSFRAPSSPPLSQQPLVWLLGGALAACLLFALGMALLAMRYSQSIQIVDKPATVKVEASGVPGPPAPSVPGPPPLQRASNSAPAPSFPSTSRSAPATPRPSGTEPVNPFEEAANTTTPSRSAANNQAKNQKPEALDPNWETEGRIPRPRDTVVTFGPPGCPVVVVGTQVWDIAKKKRLIDLEGDFFKDVKLHKLSPDGNFFASSIEYNGESNLGVWDTRTGEQTFRIPGKWEDRHFVHLSNDLAVLGGDRKSEIEVWKLATGKREAVRTIFLARPEGNNTSLTLDGLYLASPTSDVVQVYRVSDGKVVAGMANRLSGGDLTKKKGATAGQLPANVSENTLWGMRSLAFSPDSQELALVSSLSENRLLSWDNRGRLVYDEPFRSEGSLLFGSRIQWLPNREGWLVDNNLVDRGSGRTVLSIKTKHGTPPFQVFDDKHLIGEFPQKPDEIDKLEIPWNKIHASLAAMEDKQPALLSPHTPIGVRLELGEIRGDQTETAKLLYTALYDRLKRDNIKVVEGAKTYFRMRFTETAGDTLPIYQRQNYFDFHGTDTGRTVTEAKGTMLVELLIEGSNEPIWRDFMSGYSSRTFYNTDINDTTVRNSMVGYITTSLRTLNFPYFIPESKDLVALPMVLQ